jgi:hypothetical protein
VDAKTMNAVSTTNLVRRVRPPYWRLRIPPVTGKVSGAREAVLLTVVPILTFGFVYAIANVSGVAYSPGCNSVSNFVRNLLFQPIKPSTCHSVPFLSDIPTVILSFTCPFALVGYRLLRRRLTSIVAALTATGLLRTQSAATSIGDVIGRVERTVDLTPARRLLFFLVSVVLVTWLYSRNLANGHLFNTLGDQPNHTSIAAGLRATWWANYHYHPVLAVVCILLGSLGVTYALRAGWLYLSVGAALYATRTSSIERLPVEFVPRWRDRSYGWSPVTGVLMLIYVSTINLAMSMVSVFDMLRNETWTLLVAVLFAVIGVVSNMLIILMSFIRMMSVHRTVENRLRNRLIRGMKPGWTVLTPGEYVVATSELASWRKVPVASFSGTVIRILPGLYALFQFTRTIFGVKH